MLAYGIFCIQYLLTVTSQKVLYLNTPGLPEAGYHGNIKGTGAY